MKNDVWDIVLRPEGKSIVTSKWIYKIKHTVDGSIKGHKMKFVARIFSHVEGIYYQETFAPISRYTYIRMIISLATSMGWRVHQMDVKTTFLNGDIEEEAYIEKPDGLVIHEKESHVCKWRRPCMDSISHLKISMQGLMDTWWFWGFRKSVVDPSLYYNTFNGKSLNLVLYIDDLFLTGTESLIVECKYVLASNFEMKDLDMMHFFLGLEVWQRTNEVFLSRGKYTVEILKKFGILNLKPVAAPMVTNMKKRCVSTFDFEKIDPTLYKQLIGSLMYLVNTRPNIFYVVSTLSQFMSHPRQTHRIVVKHVLRYLQGIIGHGMRYTSSIGMIW
jgi:hypothetical protein